MGVRIPPPQPKTNKMKDTAEERKASKKVTDITNAREIPEFDLLMQCSKHQLADKLTHFLCVIKALRETQNK